MRTTQYGLLADDVADSLLGLVSRDAAGDAQSVRTDFLPALLIAEVQRLERERASLARHLAEQAAAIAELRSQLDRMRGTR